jgi:hypothetical protein
VNGDTLDSHSTASATVLEHSLCFLLESPNIMLCGGPPRCEKMVRRFQPVRTS